MGADASAAAIRLVSGPAEAAFTFEAAGEALVGILHEPAGGTGRRGVLVVVGGPQYRVGSHRQFVLLARDLAAAGIPVLRFDYRGMGDASGAVTGFEAIDPDIRAAVDAFFERVPNLEEVVLWGLCDAASAALFYAWQDPRITGVVLLNPWVRTEESQARARIKHYYRGRLLSGAFWRKAVTGRWNPAATLHSLTTFGWRLLGRRRGGAPGGIEALPLPDRMAEGLTRYSGRVMVVLSGDDLTAAEFKETVQQSQRWRHLLADERVEHFELEAANHTFSRQAWRDAVSRRTREWVQSW